jgi:hypothetical protein
MAFEDTTAMTYIDRVSSGLQALAHTAVDAWQRRRELCNLNDYWQSFPAEADRLALDVGLQRLELIRVSGQRVAWRSLLGARLNALGAELCKLETEAPEYARDLARVCALCDSKARCARDLKRRPESGIWRTYCPNESTLNQVTRTEVVDRMFDTLKSQRII